MKTTQSTPRKAAKKAPAKKRGNLKPGEIRPLIMAARKAYDFQTGLGMTDGETFDQWRKRECQEAVQRDGITACYHEDFRPLLSHFQTLAGDDGKAFENAMKSGKPRGNAEEGDTHEARRQMAFTIAEVLTGHIHLAETSSEQLLEETKQIYKAWLELDAEAQEKFTPLEKRFADLMNRKNAIAAKGKGPISVGYVVFLVRQKTRRPDLTLGKDWEAGLAERCTVRQLQQIHFTIVNRINALEGVGNAGKRNKSQKTPKAKAERQTKGEDFRY